MTNLAYLGTIRVRSDGTVGFQDADFFESVMKIAPGLFEVRLAAGLEAPRTCPWVMPWSATGQPALAVSVGVSSLSDTVLSVSLGADVGFCLRLEGFQQGEVGK